MKKIRILIVEDNVDSAETMQMLLSISGYDAASTQPALYDSSMTRTARDAAP